MFHHNNKGWETLPLGKALPDFIFFDKLMTLLSLSSASFTLTTLLSITRSLQKPGNTEFWRHYVFCPKFEVVSCVLMV